MSEKEREFWLEELLLLVLQYTNTLANADKLTLISVTTATDC